MMSLKMRNKAGEQLRKVTEENSASKQFLRHGIRTERALFT